LSAFYTPNRGAPAETPAATTTTQPGGTSFNTTAPRMNPDATWHYHNYWGTLPYLALLNSNYSLPVADSNNPTVATHTASVDFTLPHGRIVPPETGEINATVFFNGTGGLPTTGLNFSYRPGGAVNYTTVPVVSGKPFSIWVSYDQTDVPHQGSTMWVFRLSARAMRGNPLLNATNPALANGTAHVVLVAWIGRPLLIDPPHFDHWFGRTSLPLVGATVHINGTKLADARYLLVQDKEAFEAPGLATIPLENGSLVPEGASEVDAYVYWNATAGFAKPLLRYAEDNSPSNATLNPEIDRPGFRMFRVTIGQGMTDSPYVNKSTWRFTLLLDGQTGSAFSGTISLHAFAVRPSGA
jgi:hypothetical protein